MGEQGTEAMHNYFSPAMSTRRGSFCPSWAQLKERFYWPGCTDAIKNWCATCAICCTRKSAAPKRRAGLQTISAGYALQVVSVDVHYGSATRDR